MNRRPAGAGCSRADRLSVDIVDYPGEWLLDLPLLGKNLCRVFARRLRAWRRLPVRVRPVAGLAASLPQTVEPDADADEMTARRAGRGLRRLSQGLQARRTGAVDAAARALPDAGRSRRLAGADLRAAAGSGRRAAAVRLAARDDGAALRGLQDACRETVLPRAHRPARPADRADRRHAGAERRPRRHGRSRSAR